MKDRGVLLGQVDDLLIGFPEFAAKSLPKPLSPDKDIFVNLEIHQLVWPQSHLPLGHRHT